MKSKSIDELLAKLETSDKAASPAEVFHMKLAADLSAPATISAAPVETATVVEPATEELTQEKIAEYEAVGAVIAQGIWKELSKLAEAIAEDEPAAVTETPAVEAEKVAETVTETSAAEVEKVAETPATVESATPAPVIEKTAEELTIDRHTKILTDLYKKFNN